MQLLEQCTSDPPSTPAHDNTNNNNTDNNFNLTDELTLIVCESLLVENLATVKQKPHTDTDVLQFEKKLAVVANESRSKRQEKFANSAGAQFSPESLKKTDDADCCPTLKLFGISTTLEHVHEGLLPDLHTLNISKKKKTNEEKIKDVLACEARTGGTTHCLVQIPKSKDHKQPVRKNRKENWMSNFLFALGGRCTNEQDENKALLPPKLAPHFASEGGVVNRTASVPTLATVSSPTSTSLFRTSSTMSRMNWAREGSCKSGTLLLSLAQFLTCAS